MKKWLNEAASINGYAMDNKLPVIEINHGDVLNCGAEGTQDGYTLIRAEKHVVGLLRLSDWQVINTVESEDADITPEVLKKLLGSLDGWSID